MVLSQRWAIVRATQARYLPLLDTREEPDVEELTIQGALPTYIHHEGDGCLNVQDVMAWLILKMAELAERETINWFWWATCTLFGEVGQFANTLD
ncbi:hypothetical protein APHAL10511_002348 [Amanita phalloides]|nr:hypothetical protein APHAL10511_002348 [Amanita phalloides]